nr:hypothetical protein [Tanacetum cinerariifolium]
MIIQPTNIPLGNNTEASGSIIESLVPDVTQSHMSNQASASSHLVPQDRWLRDQHIKIVNIIGDPEQYTRNLLKKDEISDSSLVKTPMVPPNNLGSDLAGKPVNETLYRGMIGSLMYLTATRSDIQFSIVICARYQSNPKESHLIAVKRILRKTPQVLVKYLVENCILWMKSQLSDYDIHYKMVPIFCDNTSAIAISNNLVLHSRIKHIDIRYHFIKDHILKGDIELHFIFTEYQLADIFTKPLDEPTFTTLKAELGMLNID